MALGADPDSCSLSPSDYDSFSEFDKNEVRYTTISVYMPVVKENCIPYGTFVFKKNPRSGVIQIYPFKINEDKVNLVKTFDLTSSVRKFFENPVEGRKHKKGMLLYGPPGNGKSSSIIELSKLTEELKLRIFFVDSSADIKSLEEIRHLLGHDRTIFVFEEMTERLNTRSMEELLTFLDGETSWNNSITIATTNYPEQFPANLIDRPGRFEEFVEFKCPDNEKIIELGLMFGFDEQESLSLAGQDLSFDYVSFIFSLAKREGLSVKEARILEEEKRSRLSKTFKGKIGF